jgi:hypothetical protein
MLSLSVNAGINVAPAQDSAGNAVPEAPVDTRAFESSAEAVSIKKPVFLKGVSVSPKSFQGVDFINFFTEAKTAGTLLSWAGDWKELAGIPKSGVGVIGELAIKHNYTFLIEPQFFLQATGKLIRPLNQSTKISYRNSVIAYVQKYHPLYLALGIEVNLLYEKSPQSFDDFCFLYDEVCEEVKAVAPETKIFTIFQLERLKGLQGGLFGGTNNSEQAQWDLLERFSKSDLYGFTTYPSLIFRDPAEIPDDYYDEILWHTSKPIAFTEIGWPSAGEPKGWESSEIEQAEFVTRFGQLIRNLNLEILIWSFLYDPNTVVPFNSMGLFKRNGVKKTAWEEWGKI